MKYFKKIIKKFKNKKSVFTNQRKEYLKYEIGNFTYVTPLIIRYDKKNKLKIGKYCSFADNVTILLGGEHKTDWITTYPFNQFFKEAESIPGHPTSKGDIIIGNDVWIGYGTTILSGVTIGDGAAIGANSLLAKNVSPYEIVAGNPAKHIKYRFRKNEIKFLLELKWWNWSNQKILENIDNLLQNSIQKLIDSLKK